MTYKRVLSPPFNQWYISWCTIYPLSSVHFYFSCFLAFLTPSPSPVYTHLSHFPLSHSLSLSKFSFMYFIIIILFVLFLHLKNIPVLEAYNQITAIKCDWKSVWKMSQNFFSDWDDVKYYIYLSCRFSFTSAGWYLRNLVFRDKLHRDEVEW